MSASSTIQDELKKINWFHRIDLGQGVTTPGIDDTKTKLDQVRLPADLGGKTVLDIGAWDGFFSFECEKRGASRVVALDGGVWRVGSIGKAGFEFARKVLKSNVEDVEMEVSEISVERLGQFDLVLFLGVLYHLPDPVGSFLKVASVAAREMIIETHVDLMEVDTPAIAFYPFAECAKDETNWCGPNKAAVEGMLQLAGFKTIRSFPMTPVVYPTIGRNPKHYGRMVFHASR
ncbi:class I SAM-dependent methyltransferase [Tundrisphaera lichenicola]|uniref:class I SAM-dependent methyltransferase n=1 Tax=Tundrisphaera lichenicola TaxID=2029860 RepID=UPI003EBD997B